MKSSGGKYFTVEQFDDEVLLAWTDPVQSGDALMSPEDARKLGEVLILMADEIKKDIQDRKSDHPHSPDDGCYYP